MNIHDATEQAYKNGYAEGLRATAKKSKIINQAIDIFGTQNQIYVAIEELSELTKELCKYLRYLGDTKNISEEMADVIIMIEQLKIIFNNESEIDKWVDKKLERLQSRICNKLYDSLPDNHKSVCDLCNDWNLLKFERCGILNKEVDKCTKKHTN